MNAKPDEYYTIKEYAFWEDDEANIKALKGGDSLWDTRQCAFRVCHEDKQCALRYDDYEYQRDTRNEAG